jgi:bacterioferritin
MAHEETITRERLVTLLNEDLAREYQAIISYVIYSQVLKGAPYMSIAAELEKHAGEELQHALLIAKQIDYFGGDPTSTPKPVRTSDKAEAMLRFDLENENETVRNYRERVRQAEALGEFALAEDLRQILQQEQEHQIDLATALGIDVPREGLGRERGEAEPVVDAAPAKRQPAPAGQPPAPGKKTGRRK